MFGSTESKKDKYKKKYLMENVDEAELEMLDKIATELSRLTKAAGLMTLNNTEQSKLLNQSVLIKQNWLIIKKLDEISNKLDK